MSLWVSGFATFYAISCAVDYYQHRKLSDLIRAFAGLTLAGLQLWAGLSA